MNAKKILHDAIQIIPGLSAYMNINDIFPNYVYATHTDNYITLELITGDFEYNKDRDIEKRTALIQVDIYNTEAQKAYEIGELIINNLSGTVASNVNIYIETVRDTQEDQKFRRSIDIALEINYQS